jgi:phenylpropionate dioxygenase-like ring-hydroxylating dioxygenase large terminal subunit
MAACAAPFMAGCSTATGQCIETPAEPVGSQLCKGIKQRSYPVIEKAGILWAYLGEGEPPAFPEIDAFVAPDSHTFAFKGHFNCNWLAGAGGRHRSVACVLPASLLRG